MQVHTAYHHSSSREACKMATRLVYKHQHTLELIYMHSEEKRAKYKSLALLNQGHDLNKFIHTNPKALIEKRKGARTTAVWRRLPSLYLNLARTAFGLRVELGLRVYVMQRFHHGEHHPFSFLTHVFMSAFFCDPLTSWCLCPLISHPI